MQMHNSKYINVFINFIYNVCRISSYLWVKVTIEWTSKLAGDVEGPDDGA